jgi:hypothetical protein
VISYRRLEEETELMRLNCPDSAQLRLRANMHMTLQRKFVNVMKEHQQTQYQIKHSIRKHLMVRVQTIVPDITPENLSNLFSAENSSIAETVRDLMHGAILKVCVLSLKY